MTMPKLRKSLVLLAALAYLLPAAFAQNAKKTDSKGEWTAYIGTYTRQKSKGIYAFKYAPATGKATPIGLAAESVNPSFLAIHPNQKFVYAANEADTYEGQPTGYLTAFAIEPGGKLVKSFEGHTHHVLDVGWKSDGKLLASAGADNVVKVWNFETGEKTRDLKGTTKQVTRLSFIGKTPNFLTAGGDATARRSASPRARDAGRWVGARQGRCEDGFGTLARS